jgi:hypothetical protein
MKPQMEKLAEKLIMCALAHPQPVFLTGTFVRAVFHDSTSTLSVSSRDDEYQRLYRLLVALEKEGTVGSVATQNSGRAWWLVERVKPVINPDDIAALWASTDSLHRRFGKYPPKVMQTLKVFDEEIIEFGDEVLAAGDDFDPAKVAEEAVDVMVTVLATLSALGIRREQLDQAVQKVIAKNNAKDHTTHYIREDGKIARRVKENS